MSKPLVAILLGAFLGALDGLSALLSDASTAPQIAGIVVGSTIKGILTGVIVGLFARRRSDTRPVVVLGLAVGFAFAMAIAILQSMGGVNHFVAIVLPGSIVGALVGYGTQAWGKAPAT